MKCYWSRSVFFVLPVLLGLVSTPLLAASAAGSVSVKDAYVRAVAPGQPNSAAFMTLHNADSTDHAVVNANSSAAKVVELHTHLNEDGVMKMRQVERITVPTHGETVLEPGSFHVMLMGLTGELTEGQSVSITLVFEDGSEKIIAAPVRKMKMRMDTKHDMSMEGHSQQ